MSLSYASVDDAIAFYGTDYVTVACDRARTGDLDTDALELHLIAASDEIDGKFVGRVPGWPWETPPPILKKYCVDIAIYSISSTGPDVLTDQKKALYEAAQRYLQDVATNKIKLTLNGDSHGATLTQTTTVATAAQNIVLQVPCARRMSGDGMKDI